MVLVFDSGLFYKVVFKGSNLNGSLLSSLNRSSLIVDFDINEYRRTSDHKSNTSFCPFGVASPPMKYFLLSFIFGLVCLVRVIGLI